LEGSLRGLDVQPNTHRVEDKSRKLVVEELD
jgi:hypothetical protein